MGGEWSLCQVVSGHEEEVEKCLIALKYNVYWPVVKEYRREAGKRAAVCRKRAVFPGYVFIQGVPEYMQVRNIEHFLYAVKFNEKPAMLTNDEIEEIKHKLGRGDFDFGGKEVEIPAHIFNVGDVVKATRMPVQGFQGKIELFSSNGREALLVDGDFGRPGMWSSVFDISADPGF